MSDRLILTPILPNGISIEQLNSITKVAIYLGLDSPDLKYFYDACDLIFGNSELGNRNLSFRRPALQFAAEMGGHLTELLPTATLDRLLALKAAIGANHVAFAVYQLCILRRRPWLKVSKKAGSGSRSGFGSELKPRIEIESPIEKGQYGLAGWEGDEKQKHMRAGSLRCGK
ncbi:hypothetical protein TWF192_005692 [Orbilia oligospora]|uniref:Uncharacterized protein n=1 Tax=Orbilia oligospora TaxID=2813651 RepID=A0A6G1MLU6_ORBOL|nr:hypothetical protein TWF191_003947 [Orbilia oligospora]KAF3263411.1 hypothetical protein TWF192_005692 [Orbilia oligospora]